MNDDLQDEPLTPEQEAEADAQFEAAFNAARGETPHAEGSTTEPKQADAKPTEPKEQPSDANEPAPAPAAEPAPKQDDEPVKLTKADLAALQQQLAMIPHLQEELRKTRDTTAGKLGSLQQTLQAVQQQAAAGKAPTLKQLKRLEGEFPELAQLLKEDLSEAFGAGEAAPAGQQDAPAQQPAAAEPTPPADPLADERVQQALRQKDQAIVDAVHPDWRNLKATPEFAEWRQQLPTAAQELLATTWDPKVMIDAFNDFKTYKQQRSTQAAAQADANKQRDRRLASAIPATTGAPTGATAIDEDAAFEEGFNAVRKR